MNQNRDRLLYSYLTIITFVVGLLILFIFGEKIIPYLIFFGIAAGSSLRIWFIVRKNKIWFFTSFFKPTKFTKNFVLIADILILFICIFIAIAFIMIKY